MIVAYTLLVIEESNPSTYKEAEISSDPEMWMNAILEEMESPHKNGTWDLLDLLKKKKAIGYKWVFVKNMDLKIVKLFATRPE